MSVRTSHRLLFVAALLAAGCRGNPSDDDETVGSTGDSAEDTTETTGTMSVPGDYGDVTCDAPLTPPATGVCGVVSEGTSGRLLRGTVLGGEALYRNGGVLISDEGLIACVGCDCDAPDATVIDCPDGVISPGLINAHDHITFANNAPMAPGVVRYDHRHEWRTGENDKPVLSVSGGASSDVVLFAELRFVMGGATSTVGSGGRAGLLRNVDSSLMEGLPLAPATVETFPLDDADGTMNNFECAYGDSPTTAAEIAGRSAYLPHIAEGIGLAARNEFVCTSDAAVANGNDLVEPQTSIVHAMGMRAGDFREVQQELAGVVWSPRSNLSLYGDTARVGAIDALGVPIALGTDWVTSGSMNLLRELRCADEFNRTYLDDHFTDLALWRMVTENAAFATGKQDALGILAPGRAADVAVFDGSAHPDFRAVIDAGVEDVVLVLRGGEVLYGDAALLDAGAVGGAACEDLDVCGAPKKACVAQDVGGATTLAGIRAAGEAFYPLFFCRDDEPTDEPTCVPWRPEYPGGITAADADGDGIDDGADVCPAAFDPIRPMDEGAQADADADGIGDACDRCPLDAGESCVPPRADDVDGDGVINAADVCPELADPGQADIDGDGHGDACDACPEQFNSGFSPCALTIAAARDLELGASVAVSGWVTAVRPETGGSQGFTLQDATGPYSGIFVLTGLQPAGVAIGDEVQVSGILAEFLGLLEITTPTVTVVDAGTSPHFAALALDSTALSSPATAEPYESMLVSLGAGTITVQNSDAPSDFDEFSVATAGGADLRVNDQFLTALDNVCPVGTAFTGLTGVLNEVLPNYKLEPRSDADLAFTGCDPTP